MIVERFLQVVAKDLFVGSEVIGILEHIVYPPVLGFVPVGEVFLLPAGFHLVHELHIVAAIVHDVVSPDLCPVFQDIGIDTVV